MRTSTACQSLAFAATAKPKCRQLGTGAVSLAPAMLLVRSSPWFAIVSVIYYGTVLLAILMQVARPPRESGLARRGLNLPPPAYVWRRFKRLFRRPGVLMLLLLPLVRMVPLR